MRLLLLLLLLLLPLACDPPPAEGEGEGEEGEGEASGSLDPDQVRLGTALVDDDGAPDVAAAALPAPPDQIAVFDLGNLNVDDSGRTGTVLITMDARVKGLTFVAYGRGLVMMVRAEDGAGAAIVDDTPLNPDIDSFDQMNGLSSGFPSQFASPSRVLPGRGAAAFPLPSSPDVALVDGVWSAVFGHFEPGVDDNGDVIALPLAEPIRVVALVRTVDVEPGLLGVALHFTGALGLTAEQAELSQPFRDRLALLQTAYGDVGVDASDVVFLDLEDGEQFATLVLDEPRCDGGDMDALVQKGLPDRLNLFFIERFECGQFGPFLLGLSPGIPNIPYAQTNKSGVIVASSFFASQPEQFAITMAHESGHALGLFHTQENDAFSDEDIFDNIEDTGGAAEARSNLMFFNVARLDSETLTPGQGKVMQANPMVLP